MGKFKLSLILVLFLPVSAWAITSTDEGAFNAFKANSGMVADALWWGPWNGPVTTWFFAGDFDGEDQAYSAIADYYNLHNQDMVNQGYHDVGYGELNPYSELAAYNPFCNNPMGVVLTGWENDTGDCQIIVGFYDRWKLDDESPSCPTATYQNGSGGGGGTFDQNMNPWSDAYPGANNLTQGFNFSDLISGFMDGLKSTSMFNLPGLLTQDLPESDECEMVIDLGETFGGEHTVSFCNWADSLGVIKGVLLLGFSFLAVRIVILKRD